ncbi:41.8 Metallo-dependent calcineurin-like phosphatase [Spodoptera frugiperda ascovirus 1a]|uniref:41.8 Metallo-dependent calcineurin-like phosphatase n=1 Tax=Spodoptera frugiperda ascovirus 1a TaxID=113370 RepID=Q0E542_SFAVA|nr:41.8 Metallo-dependent calcineurin-like phosphatase [Spodoptera frugiperda ascovirus 1a]CAL44659.1 41.8 Metallo-dependent calcineurin-like phosphatase [Spodoptera frugiperda ascovirus 1a]
MCTPNRITDVLFVGDPHFKKDNFEQTKCYTDECLRVYAAMANDHPYRCCVLAGDILDGHGVIDMQCLNRAVEFIDSLSNHGDVFVLVGNHDYYNNAQCVNENHWMNCLKKRERVFIVDKPCMYDGIVFTPYTPNGCMVQMLDEYTPDWKHARLVIGHQEVRGVQLHDNVTSTGGDVWLDTYPQLVSGHIHTRQKIARNVWYPGSVIQHKFGDRGVSKVVILHIDPTPSAYTYTDIDINVPTKRYVEVKCDDIVHDQARQLNMIRDELRQGGDLLQLKVRIHIEDLNLRRHPAVLKFIKHLPFGVKFMFKFVNVGPSGAQKFDMMCEEITTNNVTEDGASFKRLLVALLSKECNAEAKRVYDTLFG